MRTAISEMCVAALDGDYQGASGRKRWSLEAMYAEVKEVASCGAKATTCEEYAKCQDVAKK